MKGANGGGKSGGGGGKGKGNGGGGGAAATTAAAADRRRKQYHHSILSGGRRGNWTRATEVFRMIEVSFEWADIALATHATHVNSLTPCPQRP